MAVYITVIPWQEQGCNPPQDPVLPKHQCHAAHWPQCERLGRVIVVEVVDGVLVGTQKDVT